jgi:DNA polymerase-3 subunit delta
MKQQPQTTTPNILKEIENGKVYPVYLLCGEESFLIESTLKQMLEALLDPVTRDFNLTVLDGLEVSVRDILSAVEVYPMMADWRVVVVAESTQFRAQRGAFSALDFVRTAADAAAEGNLRKAISLMVKALGVSAPEIAEQRAEYLSAARALIEENQDDLTPETLEFLNELPLIASQIEDLPQLSAAPDDTELLIEWLQGDLPKQSVLIFTFKDNVDERSRLVKAIDQAGRYVSYAPVEVGKSVQQDKVFRSVSKKLEGFGKKISPTAFKLLQERTGNDMHLIAEAIEKMVAFVGEKTRIDDRDVETLIPQSSFENIFALTDAIGKRALPQALQALRSVLNGGEPPIKVNALIVRQLRLMLQAKLLVQRGELQPNAERMPYQRFVDSVFKPLAARRADLLPESAQLNLLKQNTYAAYKIIQALPFFSTDELIECLGKTLEADIELKSSQLDPECILEQLIYEICARKDGRRISRYNI